MTIELPADVQPIVDKAIAAGQCANETEVVRRALHLYEQFERRRQTLVQDIQQGIDSGDSIPGAVVFQELEHLAQELSRRAATSDE